MKSLLPTEFSPKQHVFLSTNYDRTEQTAIEIFQGMYPLEPNLMTELCARASDHSKSLFNPLKDTSLHKALVDGECSQALAVARTTQLPDALFQNKTICPEFTRVIGGHNFDMEGVKRKIQQKLRP